MELELICLAPDGRRHPVVVELSGDTSVGNLRAALIETLDGPGQTSGPLYAGRDPLADTMTVAQVGLMHGTALGLGRPVYTGTDLGSSWELAVVAGLHGGLTLPITQGSDRPLIVGRRADADLALPDPEVSRTHAVITVTSAGNAGLEITVMDNGSRNGVRHLGSRLAGPTRLDDGIPVALGQTLLMARALPTADADLAADPRRGTLLFKRPPRVLSPESPIELTTPVPPVRPSNYRLRSWRAYRAEAKAYRVASEALTATLHGHAEVEQRRARAAAPDPAWLVRLAEAPSARLWERRPTDPDFLHLRVGVHDRPANITLRPDPQVPALAADGVDLPPTPQVFDVPVLLDLAGHRIVGVAGPRPATLAAMRAMLVQCAALHAPTTLAIVVITNEDNANDWEWTTWLPHTRPPAQGFRCDRLIATNTDQTKTRVAEICQQLSERNGPPADNIGSPAILVVLDGTHRPGAVAGLVEPFAAGPELGIYALCLDSTVTSLPKERRATLVTTPAGTQATLYQHDAEPIVDILLDGLSAAAATRLGRALAPLRVLDSEITADVPRKGNSAETPAPVIVHPRRVTELGAPVSPQPAPSQLA